MNALAVIIAALIAAFPLNWLAKHVFFRRYRHDDILGVKVTKEGYPLCSQCLAEGRENKVTLERREKDHTVYWCAKHKLIRGANRIDVIKSFKREVAIEIEPHGTEAATPNTPDIFLSAFTSIAFEVNAMIDACPERQPSFDEIYREAEKHNLVRYLAEKYSDIADFSLLLSRSGDLRIVEATFSDAASALQGRERRKVGVESSGYCLLQAIVIEAMQLKFSGYIFDAVTAPETSHKNTATPPFATKNATLSPHSPT